MQCPEIFERYSERENKTQTESRKCIVIEVSEMHGTTILLRKNVSNAMAMHSRNAQGSLSSLSIPPCTENMSVLWTEILHHYKKKI